MSTRSTAALESYSRLEGLASIRVIPVGAPVHNQLTQMLYEEAAALDERRFDDWFEMLDEDLRYDAPIRVTRTGPNRDLDVCRAMYHFNDTYASIQSRLQRLAGKSAWAEDPPSRTRRFVSNVRAAETDKADEFEAVSYLFLVRSRGDEWRTEQLSCERRDLWRRHGASFKLARREIIVDQSTLGMSNLAVFL